MTDHNARQAGLTEALHYLQMGIANLELGNGVHMIDFRNAERAILAALVPFQERVQPWMLECFGAEIASDRIERNHRFFEEATELVQSNGMTRSEAHQLVDYTFDRPVGDLHQEVGGVMVTLAALCLASGADMHAAGETELARIWTKVEQIRAKQAAKPKHSHLPAAPAPAAQAMVLHGWRFTNREPGVWLVRPPKGEQWVVFKDTPAYLLVEAIHAARQQFATPAEPDIQDELRQTLEIIGVGDSKNPQLDAANTLVTVGIWTAVPEIATPADAASEADKRDVALLDWMDDAKAELRWTVSGSCMVCVDGKAIRTGPSPREALDAARAAIQRERQQGADRG